MRLSHARHAMSVRFDDPNLVSCGGLAAVLALATRCGLATLLGERLRIAAKGGTNATAKILALIAGMICGADSISDMDLLRHGGMGRVFDGVRAPSTLGTFLRRFTFGHVRQLDAVAAGLLARLACATPLLPGADQIVFVDIDDTVRQTYGYAKQGAGRGYTGVKGLNALLAVASTPTSAPVTPRPGCARGRRTRPGARGNYWPTPWPPRGAPALDWPATRWCWCGRTPPTTASTSSTSVAGPRPDSPSPPGSPRRW
jgi:hypothetical protein